MPHQCTSCGRRFADGSKEMLGGCPDCGGNKFQYAPSVDVGSSTGSADPSTGSAGSEPAADDPASGGSERSPATPVDDPRSERDRGESELADDATGFDRRSSAGDRARENAPGTETPEDTAQANARSDVVTRDELPTVDESPTTESSPGDGSSPVGDSPRGDGSPPGDEGATGPEGGRVVSEPTDDQPSLEELRAELNEQFESIKIVQPGQYELNLMELYNRDEYIISLQEDGRYVIDVPESWRSSESDLNS